MKCEACGAPFRRTVAALKRTRRHFCSAACAHTVAGEQHTSYRGPTDPNRGAGWRRLAERIRERDGYRCKRCRKTQEQNGRKLSVDHIVPWRNFEDKAAANAETNLISLCLECHSWKTSVAEARWLKGDVIAFEQYVRAISMP